MPTKKPCTSTAFGTASPKAWKQAHSTAMLAAQKPAAPADRKQAVGGMAQQGHGGARSGRNQRGAGRQPPQPDGRGAGIPATSRPAGARCRRGSATPARARSMRHPRSRPARSSFRPGSGRERSRPAARSRRPPPPPGRPCRAGPGTPPSSAPRPGAPCPARRSAQYVSAIPPAPAAANSRVAASPAIVIWYEADQSRRGYESSVFDCPPITPRKRAT